MIEGISRLGAGVGALLMRNSKVLLGRRHPDPAKASSLLDGAGKWTMPGGKVRPGETLEEAASRETFEETGLDIDPKYFVPISLSQNILPGVHFITVGLLCRQFVGEPVVAQPDQIIGWDFFELSALPSPLYYPSEQVLTNYGNGVFYGA